MIDFHNILECVETCRCLKKLSAEFYTKLIFFIECLDSFQKKKLTCVVLKLMHLRFFEKTHHKKFVFLQFFFIQLKKNLLSGAAGKY